MTEGRRDYDLGSPVLDQLTLAQLIASGSYDRHLRIVRRRYRQRRDALVQALTSVCPRWRLRGIAAGLHVVAERGGDIGDGCRRRRRRAWRPRPAAGADAVFGRPAGDRDRLRRPRVAADRRSGGAAARCRDAVNASSPTEQQQRQVVGACPAGVGDDVGVDARDETGGFGLRQAAQRTVEGEEAADGVPCLGDAVGEQEH